MSNYKNGDNNMDGIPRGVNYRVFKQNPNTLEPEEVDLNPAIIEKHPISKYINELISNLNTDEQEIVNKYKFIFDGDLSPKSKETLEDRTKYIFNESSDNGNNKTELLKLFALFSSYFPNY